MPRRLAGHVSPVLLGLAALWVAIAVVTDTVQVASIEPTPEAADPAQPAPSTLVAPPPGGIVQGLAGTSDPAALVASLDFDVQAIWVLDIPAQRWRAYVPGAPSHVSTLSATGMGADDVVTVVRAGSAPQAGAMPARGPRPVTGTARVLTTPPEGGVTLGIAGTNDPAAVAMAQPFEVSSVWRLDPASQRWLVYVPGAPAFVSTLHTGTLEADSVVVVGRVGPRARAAAVPVITVDEASEARMLELVNQERARAGLPALTLDPTLREVARAHSRDMWVRDFFSHKNPDGQSPFQRLQAAGVTYQHAAENLALAGNVDRAHQNLMGSDGHRQNILNGNLRRVGIGVVTGPDGKMFTQVFTD